MKLQHSTLKPVTLTINSSSTRGHKRLYPAAYNRSKEITAMASKKDKKVIYYALIKKYVNVIKKHNIPVCRLYLYGSYAKDTYYQYSDIELAVFWNKDEIDGFDEEYF